MPTPKIKLTLPSPDQPGATQRQRTPRLRIVRADATGGGAKKMISREVSETLPHGTTTSHPLAQVHHGPASLQFSGRGVVLTPSGSESLSGVAATAFKFERCPGGARSALEGTAPGQRSLQQPQQKGVCNDADSNTRNHGRHVPGWRIRHLVDLAAARR